MKQVDNDYMLEIAGELADWDDAYIKARQKRLKASDEMNSALKDLLMAFDPNLSMGEVSNIKLEIEEGGEVVLHALVGAIKHRKQGSTEVPTKWMTYRLPGVKARGQDR